MRSGPEREGCRDPRGWTSQAGYSIRAVACPLHQLTQLLRWNSDDPNRPSRVQIEVANALTATPNNITDALSPDIFLRVDYQIGQAQYQVPVDLRPGGTVFGVLASGVTLYVQNRLPTSPAGGGALSLSASMVPETPEAPPPTRTVVVQLAAAPPTDIAVPQRARFVTVMPATVNTYAYQWLDGGGNVIGGFNLAMAIGQPIPIIVPPGAATLRNSANGAAALVTTSHVFELDI